MKFQLPVDSPPAVMHRMSLHQFHAQAVAVLLSNHRRKFQVYFGDVSLGFSDALAHDQAVKDIHKSLISNGLWKASLESPGELAIGLVLPSLAAVNSHQEFSTGDQAQRYSEVLAKIRNGLKWTRSPFEKAYEEGWQLVKEGDALKIVGHTGLSDLEDSQAWSIVWEGEKSHHLLARTIIAAQSPQEYERLAAWYETVKFGQRHADEQIHQRERN